MNNLINIFKDKNIPVLFTLKDLNKLNINNNKLEELFNEAIMKYQIYNVYNDIYTLARNYRGTLISEGVLAQKIYPNSYASLLYVLSSESWIPEAVYNVTSVIEGKEIIVDTEKFGSFIYSNVCNKLIYNGVYQIETKTGIYLRAKPLKALCDYICKFGHNWDGMEMAYDYLRVKYNKIKELKSKDFDEIQGSYNINNVETFLKNLKGELNL